MRHDAGMANWTSIDSYRRSKRRRGWQRSARAALADVRFVGLGGFVAALVYFQAGLPVPWGANAVEPAASYAESAANGWRAAGDRLQARFGLCHSGGGTNCVVDGDTFWFQGQKIRIADIDTPETHPPRCAEEARLGAAATERLQDLLNAGPFTLEYIDRNSDNYGRALRTVTRGGESLGGVLVDEGLARWYGSGRQPWC